MKLKYKISIFIISIMLVTTLSIASSYAIWTFRVSQESTNVVVADCFQITFSDNNPVYLEYSFPMRDSDGVQTTPYTFTITNICNYAADFQVNLETLNTSTLAASNIKADLNGHITAYSNAESVAPTITGASSAAKLYEDTLQANTSKTYNLRIWVKENAVSNQVENKSYASKISVRATLRKRYAEGTLADGSTFITTIRTLSGEELLSEEQLNTTIKHIQRSNSAPLESNNAVNVAAEGTTTPIYVWFDTDTIYLYTTLDKIYMNENSANMFYGLSEIEDIDLSYFDTSKVTNMEGMFAYMSSLTSLDVSNFDTSNVTDMSNMFNAMSSLTSLDVSNFDTSKVTNMNNMFSEMLNLTTIYSNSFDISSLENSEGMFWNTTRLVGGSNTQYNPDHSDATYAHVDGETSNPGYFTALNN